MRLGGMLVRGGKQGTNADMNKKVDNFIELV